MTTCPRCHNTVDDGRLFCTFCGAAIAVAQPDLGPPGLPAGPGVSPDASGWREGGQPPGEVPPHGDQHSDPVDPDRRGGGQSKVLAAAGAVLAVVLLVGGAYFTGNRIAAKDASQAPLPATVQTTVQTVQTTVHSTLPIETLVHTVTGAPVTGAPVTVTSTATATTTVLQTVTQSAASKVTASAANGTVPLSTEIGSSRYLITFTIADYDRDGFTSAGRAAGTEVSVDNILYKYGLETVPKVGTYADMGQYWQEYRINKEWSTFTSVVGIADKSDSPEPVDFKVLGDGKVLTEGTTRKGDPKKVSVSVQGVTVLRLSVSAPSLITSSNYDPRPSWGDPQLHK